MASLPDYAELHCLSNFSFLRGASHPKELVQRAADLGHAAIGIADRNTGLDCKRPHFLQACSRLACRRQPQLPHALWRTLQQYAHWMDTVGQVNGRLRPGRR